MDSNQCSSIDNRILEVVDFYRGIILDAVEQEAGGLPNWKYLRSRILKALGDRGLAKQIAEILKSNRCSDCKSGGGTA